MNQAALLLSTSLRLPRLLSGSNTLLRSVRYSAFVVAAFTGCTTKDGLVGKFDAANLQVQNQNGIVMQNEKPFTGIVYTLNENKKDTTEIVEFKDGKEHGQWKTFYDDGKLKSIRFFDNGKKTGVYTAWWPDGKMELEYHFGDGEYEGTCKEWNNEGMLINERTYKNGYEEGLQKQFYDNGKVKSNYVMVDGKRYGLLGTKNCVNVTDSIFKN